MRFSGGKDVQRMFGEDVVAHNRRESTGTRFLVSAATHKFVADLDESTNRYIS